MSCRFTRLTMIALLAIFTSFTIAQAQVSSKVVAPPTAKVQNAHPGNGSGQSLLKNNKLSPQFAMGWNYVHAANCNLYTDSGYNFLVIYPKEGGYFYTTDPTYQNLLSPACQSGNVIAVYFYDDSGDWNSLFTYTYQ